MSHLMSDGQPCGLKGGHPGRHRSVESIERRREQDRQRKRQRYATELDYRERQRDYQREWHRARWATDPKYRARQTIAQTRRRLQKRTPEDQGGL